MPADPTRPDPFRTPAPKPGAAFSMDRVLAYGPSAAWLDAGRSMLSRLPRPAPITGFVDHG